MRSVRALDNVSFTQWFTSHGGSRQSIKKMWDPIGARPGQDLWRSRQAAWEGIRPVCGRAAAQHAAAGRCRAAGSCRPVQARPRLSQGHGPLLCPLRGARARVSAAYALGFLDCDNISARCMLSIFQFFATKTDASVLRMLSGSPAVRLLQPIADYITERGGRIHTKTGCRWAPHGRTSLTRGACV